MKGFLIPEPQSIQFTQGILREESCRIAPELLSFVPKAGELFPHTGGDAPITLALDASMDEEQYRLTVTPQGAAVAASTPQGAYYALCTLSQLFQLYKGEAPYCIVEDSPSMPVRGFTDDISRGQISTLDHFKSIIRRLSRIKCNLYMPYIEDVLQFRCMPESGKFSDPMSPQEWKELIAYAKEYYVRIVPIINTLGHWDKNASLQAFQECVLHEGDDPNGAPLSALDVRKQSVQDMVAAMVEEAVEVFGEAGALHVGGDEAAAYTRLFPKDEAARYYNGHFRRLYEQLKGHGLQTMMYCDMYTPVWGDYQIGLEKMEEMPEDMDFVYWDYACRDGYPNIRELIRRHKRFFLSPATHSWSRFLPQHYLSWLNTKSMAAEGAESARGILMSAWCDDGLNLREENWMGLYSGALFSWNCHSQMTFDETVSSFFQLFYGIDIDLEEYHNLMDYDLCFTDPEYCPETYGKPIEFWYCERQDAGTRLFQEFFKDATLPVDPDLKGKLAGAQERFQRGLGYFSGLSPSHNETAYRTFLFDIKRNLAAAKKTDLILDRPYRSREEAMADIPAIESLIQEVTALMEENRRLWFACNRQSEWDSAQCKYLELLDSLRSLARYCRYGKKLTSPKKMLLGV